MTWQGIHEHDEVVEAFRHCAKQGRLANAYLFVGPAGIGKRSFANQLVKTMLCESHNEWELIACGHCDSCQQVSAGMHPDVIVIEKADDENFIPIEAFIGDREHRNQVGLCHDIGLKPFSGRRKFAIVDDADFLNIEGANSLLKTLEEPPPGSILILIGSSEQLQLPTIRSRCQTIRFGSLTTETVTELLSGIDSNADVADVARSSEGSVGRAEQLLDEQTAKFRSWLIERLSFETIDSVELGRKTIEFVEAVGTDTFARRARIRVVLDMTIELFRQHVRQGCQLEVVADSQVTTATQKVKRSASQAANAIDVRVDTREHLDANANLTGLMLWWAEELGLSAIG